MKKQILNIISVVLFGCAFFFPMREMLFGFIIGIILTNSLFIIISE